MEARDLKLPVPEAATEVSARLLRPSGGRSLLLLAHGAGAGMRHPFLEGLAARLAERGLATLRYQFPYMERGERRPDPPARLVGTAVAAAALAREVAPELPLLAGGKSLGGRMISTAAAEGRLAGVRGLVFFGFPLHPAGRPGTARAVHLERVNLPMLFLQGTRDALADLALLAPICGGLARRARLHVVEGADHGFHVLKRSGRTDAEALDELADATSAWAAEVLRTGPWREGSASPLEPAP